MAESGCLRDAHVQNLEVGGPLCAKRNVITTGAATEAINLNVEQSGSLVNLAGTASQIQVINLPTITAADIGTYYDFVVTVSGASGAAGSYTINTGGHATSALSRTAGYDDFIGTVLVAETTDVLTAAGDALAVTPAAGEGTLVIASDTANGGVIVNSYCRVTAIIASTIGVAAANVWHISGLFRCAEATSYVTTAIFTAP